MPSPRPVAAATHDVPGQSPPITNPTPNTRPPTSCGSEERLRHVDARQVEHAEPPEPERAEHRGDDRAEHHLEHGEVGEIELPGELARAAHARALEAPAERDADHQRGDERAAVRRTRRTRRTVRASLTDPRASNERRDEVRRGERADHEQPTAHAEQRAAGERLPARASAREHGAESHHRAAAERGGEARVARQSRPAFDLEAQSSGEPRREQRHRSRRR